MVRGVAVSGGHPGRVDVKRGGCTGMAEPVRHGAHVDPRGQQFGGNEMPDVMDANVDEPGRLAEAFQRRVINSGRSRRGRW